MTMTTIDRGDTQLAERKPINLNIPAGQAMPMLKSVVESQREKLAMVLPKHLTPERLMRVVLVAVSKSRDLQECSINSILQCVMTGAQLGLDCSGVLGSAYMVPFFNKNTGMKEAQFIPGYRGLIDLARRSGQIEDIVAHCVYKGDEFRLELGGDPKLIHVPDLSADRSDDNIIGAYMVARLKGNTFPHYEFVPRSDIEKVRKSSKASGRGPWVDWFAEMCRKTAIRRGIKYLPMSVELSSALELDDRANAIETHVVAAETGSRTQGVLNKITSRGTSEHQSFEPIPGAEQEVDRQQSDAGSDLDAQTTHTEPEPPPAGSGSYSVSSWNDVLEHCEAAAQAAGLSEGDLKKRLASWALVLGVKGAENKTTAQQRVDLIEAVRAGRLGEDGKILPS